MNETEKRQLFGEPQRRRVALAEIRREDGAQVREALNTAATLAYADAYRDVKEGGEELPPIVLFDDHGCLRMADGFHRYVGAGAAGLLDLDAEIYVGDLRKARFYAAAANAQHGVRRTPETITRAIQVLLDDPEWRSWSDRHIGRHVGCSHTTVARRRAELEAAEAAAAGKGQQQGLFDEPVSAPPPPKVRKGADGRTINVENIGKGKEEERIDKANAEAERYGRVDAGDSAPRSRAELLKSIKETTGIEVPKHAAAGLYRAYEEARLLEQRARARGESAPPLAHDGAPAFYQSVLGGAAGQALQGKPLRVVREEEEDEVDEDGEEDDSTDQPGAAAQPSIADMMQRAQAELGAALDKSAPLQARIAELESTLKATEEHLQREQRAAVDILSAVTRLASLWKGQHDGPRAQLLEALEVAENAQALTEQWDRALQRAAELGRQESAALVADLQRQLGEAKGRENMVRRDVLCEEPDCGRYTEAPQGGGLALCDHHRPDAVQEVRAWQAVYGLSDGDARASRVRQMEPQTWQDLGAALVLSYAVPTDLNPPPDAETFAAQSLEQVTTEDEIDLGQLRPRERAALLEGVQRELKVIGEVLARRQAQATPAAPKGRKARAPKAEPAPAPQPPEPAAAPTWLPASIGGAKAVHAVEAAAEKSGEVADFRAALCGQRPDGKGWTRRYNNPTCKECLRAVEVPRG